MLLILLAAILLSTAPAAADPPATEDSSRVTVPRFFPVRFDSEVVKLTVAGDTLSVEGTYRLLISPTRRPVLSLLFPYPADSLLGDAHTSVLECRAPDGPWQELAFQELAEHGAARWPIPLDLGPVLEVRTVYHQVLHGRYARYIVTTTAAWGRPLRQARFEIRLPAGATPTRFSFPFSPEEEDGDVFYLFEAEEFLPERDIIVEWKG